MIGRTAFALKPADFVRRVDCVACAMYQFATEMRVLVLPGGAGLAYCNDSATCFAFASGVRHWIIQKGLTAGHAIPANYQGPNPAITA